MSITSAMQRSFEITRTDGFTLAGTCGRLAKPGPLTMIVMLREVVKIFGKRIERM